MSNARNLADLMGTNTLVPQSKVNLSLGASDLPSGTILQVKSTADTTSAAQTSTGSTWADLGSLSVSITPSSSSNKIMVIANICAGQAASNPYALWFRLVRGSTVIGVGNSTNNRAAISTGHTPIGTYMDDDIGSSSIMFLDSPSTTSATTYKVQGQSRAVGNWAYNMSDDQQNSSSFAQGVSTITVMEIAG